MARSIDLPRRGRLRVALLVPFLALSLSSCRSTNAVASDDGMNEPPDSYEAAVAAKGLSFATIQQGAQSGVSHALYAVIDTQERWEALWAQHANRTLPRPEAPEVDFKREVALVLSLGPCPTAGYWLDVKSVRQEDGALVVEARESKPLPGSAQAAVVTTPFHFVRTKRFVGPVEFRIL